MRPRYLHLYLITDPLHKLPPRLVVAHSKDQAVARSAVGCQVRRATHFEVYGLARDGVTLEYALPRYKETA